MGWTRLRSAAVGVVLSLALVAGTAAVAAGMREHGEGERAPARFTVTTSSCAPEASPAGAVDGDRFSTASRHLWRAADSAAAQAPVEARRGLTAASAPVAWWEIRFAAPQRVGALFLVLGDHEFVLRHGPKAYVWEASEDGRSWRELKETRQEDEQRAWRLQRLKRARTVRALRLRIDRADGPAPVVREVEWLTDPGAAFRFPDWIVAVNVTHDATLPGHGQEFIPLARAAVGAANSGGAEGGGMSGREGGGLPAQQVWLTSFDREFVEAEPRPLAAFLSGSFKDWCEVERRHWRGIDSVLRSRRLPLWASCGGAQGLAILAESGWRRPWDCPHCRDPRRPRLPIYTHIGHTGVRPCGDYSACVFERGPHEVQALGADPVFAGLSGRFRVMESHCGQIEWAPDGWELVATAGEGRQTKTQCLRLRGHPIYAAQFHIEMAGTPEVSQRIMANFLGLARDWRRAHER